MPFSNDLRNHAIAVEQALSSTSIDQERLENLITQNENLLSQLSRASDLPANQTTDDIRTMLESYQDALERFLPDIYTSRPPGP